MHVSYTDPFHFPLPAGHRFPLEKYRRLRERLEEAGEPDLRLHVPAAATDDELLTTHSPEYLHRLATGEIPRAAELRLGLPWSPELIERGRRSCGATIEAARLALKEGVAASLAGGTHHAFRDRGEGYCLFNDSVVATRVLRREGVLARTIVIDLDVHQGNGTAQLAADDPDFFSFSIHAAQNYPEPKERSDLDVELPDGTDDGSYLAALAKHLPGALDRADADLAFFIAGADPYHDDRLGRLALTAEGLSRRDRQVLERCEERGLPVVVTLGGGYARRIDDTVAIQARTIIIALEAWRRRRRSLAAG